MKEALWLNNLPMSALIVFSSETNLIRHSFEKHNLPHDDIKCNVYKDNIGSRTITHFSKSE